MKLSKREAFIWRMLSCPMCEAWGETQDHDSQPHLVFDGPKKEDRVVWHGFGDEVGECEFMNSLEAYDLKLVKMDTWIKLHCPCGETTYGKPDSKPLCQSCWNKDNEHL